MNDRGGQPCTSRARIGWDGHKVSMAVAYVAQADSAEVVSLGHSGTRQWDLAPLSRKMPSKSPPRLFVSAAGPGGAWRYRSLTTKGPGGGGGAPSVLPHKPGERGPPNRREARKRARRARSGALPPVDGPPVEAAAGRDRCRARAEVSRALQTAQCRRQAWRLRHAIRCPGPAPWRPAPRRGLSAVGRPTPAPPSGCQADVSARTDHTARLARLDHARTEPGPPWRLAPVVDALQTRRGGPWTGAVTTGAARGALPRVAHPRQRMPARGFTPAADAPGARRPQGGSTQTGPSPARRALREGAWASRAPATVRWPRP